MVFQEDQAGVKKIATDGAIMVRDRLPMLKGQNVQLQYSPESFTGTELDYALEVCEAVMDIWAPIVDNRIILNLPSTVEMSTPNIYADQIEWMHRNFTRRDRICLSVHPHNDRGTGVAAAEMAIEGETVAAVWHSDADVITAHFETREEKREAAGEAKKRVKPEDSEQACQSRWAAWAQRQRPRRRTRSLIDVATTVMVANKIGKAPPPLVAVPPLPHRQGLYARPQSARRAAEATAVLAPAVKGSSGRAVAEARRAWLG